jgi:hypothetical protein
MTKPAATPPLPADRRAAVRRTALIVAACAVASYLLFFVSVLAGK